MLKDDVVIAVHNISKKYYINKSGLFRKEKEEDAFWALKDVSFEVQKGQILGIIGLNGAGKSTILKILADIIPPTSGHIEYRGNILSILDIGTGFHPDLSGYDNIFLNASLLGMKKSEIAAKADEIIEFSGIKDFINEPVKNYSNGMYLRLALSIALFTNNEIILLDEVISVGDVEFRYKAIQKIREQANEGKACILISHDLGSILELCDNCLLLEKGRVIYSGKSKTVVEDYFNTVYNTFRDKDVPVLEHNICRLIEVKAENENVYMDEPVNITIDYEVKKKEDVRVILKIRNYQSPVMTDALPFRPEYTVKFLEPGKYRTTCVIPANLFNAGSYFVDVILSSGKEMFIEYKFATKFIVAFRDWELNKIWNVSNEIIPFRPLCDWETREVK